MPDFDLDSKSDLFPSLAAALSVPEGDNDLQEICGGTHQDTGETITSHKKTANPLLHKTRTKGMCKELGNISHGYGDKKGTNTVHFLTHNEIAKIPPE